MPQQPAQVLVDDTSLTAQAPVQVKAAAQTADSSREASAHGARVAIENAQDVSGADCAPFAHRLDASTVGLPAGLAADSLPEPFLRWSLARVLNEGGIQESGEEGKGESSAHAPGARPPLRSEVRRLALISHWQFLQIQRLLQPPRPVLQQCLEIWRLRSSVYRFGGLLQLPCPVCTAVFIASAA